MEHAQNVAIIHQTGGGTGMTYEFLRPAGSMVNSTRGVASGPVSFMNIVNQTTEVVKQGGVRRGANMGILSVSHPDILRFIHAKNDQSSLTNFNISVTVTDAFMDAVDAGVWFQTEFNNEPWTQAVHDVVTGADYVVYRRPDGTPSRLPINWLSRSQIFPTARSTNRQWTEWFSHPTSGTASSLPRTNMPSRELFLSMR